MFRVVIIAECGVLELHDDAGFWMAKNLAGQRALMSDVFVLIV